MVIQRGDDAAVNLYNQGVREGAFGLLLNSVVLGISSFFIEPMCKRIGARLVWALSNFIVFACMAGTAIISSVSISEHFETGGIKAVEVASLVVFAILGFPLAITYSVPFSVTAELTADSGGGQGLAIGVLNLAIVIPQMVVSIGAGPWDALFGGGNIPAFVLAAIAALAAGVRAFRAGVPRPEPRQAHPRPCHVVWDAKVTSHVGVKPSFRLIETRVSNVEIDLDEKLSWPIRHRQMALPLFDSVRRAGVYAAETRIWEGQCS
ncbi:hypothetical protein NL676_032372 [Syzygium grande]|nr:hypothetical protein NL676_032372 [Syzygium grande]